MKIGFRSNVRSIAATAALLCLVAVAAASATIPQYQIYDIGVIEVGDIASQGEGVSHGGIAVGQSLRTDGSQAFTWTLKGGLVPLPNLPSRSFAVSNSATVRAIGYSADFSQSEEADAVTLVLPSTYTLTVSMVGPGSVSLNLIGGVYIVSTVVTVTATPATNWVFHHWAGDALGTSLSISVAMT